MSPERPITNDTGGVSSTTSIGGARLEPSANMVISSIPLETILQQHLQNSKTNNSSNSVNIISNNSNSGYSNNNQTYTINLNGISQSNMTITSSSNSPATTISAPSSKLVLLHQNHGSDNYAVASDSSNVGNIVLVATEKMEMTNTDHDIINNNVISGNHRNVNNVATDEELTPLTWLHDKNLLKGINLSKVQTTTSPESPRQITPTSDFVEDSSEIQDSANSSQSTGMYSADSTSNIKTNSNFQMQNNHAIMTNKNSDCTISDFSQTVATEEKVFTSSGTVVQNSSPSPTSSTGSLYSSSTNSTSPSSNSSTPHQHFHKKYLREEHAKTLKQLSNSFVTPTKQQFSPIESESLEDRSYQNTPTKNGYSMSSPTPSYTSESQDYHNFNYSNKTSPSPQSPSKMQQSKQKHPTNVPYDPLVHVTSKPPYSFSSLIFMAIENAQQKALPVKEIYAWIIQNFPYFKTAPTGWKNSVRHNLSLNKCFQKVEKAANLGKGSLWMVEQQYRPNLLQALSRSPYHPCLDKTVYKSNNSSSAQRPIEMASNGANSKSSNRLPDPEHFPYLSRRLAALGQATEDDDDDDYNESRSTTPIDYENENHYINNTIVLNNNGNSWRADSIEDVNAATAMLALKHGPKIFNDEFHNGNPPVITTSPSEDHTYSAGGTLGNRSKSSSDNNSNGSSAYESSEESQNLHIDDIEEQRRQAGVDALLNLAGIATTDYTNINTHTITPTSSPLKRPASSVQYTTTYVLNDGQMTHNRSYYITEDVNQYSSPPKKSKSRMMKSKLKKKAWMR